MRYRMAELVIGSYGMFWRRKRKWTELAGGRSHRRYAVTALATAGNNGSSIGTLVFGLRARSTPPHQYRFCSCLVGTVLRVQVRIGRNERSARPKQARKAGLIAAALELKPGLLLRGRPRG